MVTYNGNKSPQMAEGTPEAIIDQQKIPLNIHIMDRSVGRHNYGGDSQNKDD